MAKPVLDIVTAPAQAKLASLRTSATAARTSLIGLGVAAAALGAGALVAFTRSMVQANDEIAKAAGRAGISASRFADLAQALRLGGGSASDVEKAYRALNRSLDEAAQGVAEYADVYEQLGLNIEHVMGLPIDDRLQAVARALIRVGDAGERSALAQQTLGRAGTTLLPALETLAGNIDHLSGLTDEQAAAAEDAADRMEELAEEVRQAKREIAEGLVPALGDLASLSRITIGIAFDIASNWSDIPRPAQLAILAGIPGVGPIVAARELGLYDLYGNLLERAGVDVFDRGSLAGINLRPGIRSGDTRRPTLEQRIAAGVYGDVGARPSDAEGALAFAGGAVDARGLVHSAYEASLRARGVYVPPDEGGGGPSGPSSAELTRRSNLARAAENAARAADIAAGRTPYEQRLNALLRRRAEALAAGDESALALVGSEIALAAATERRRYTEDQAADAAREKADADREAARALARENAERAREVRGQFGLRDRLGAQYRRLLFRSGEYGAANALARTQGLGVTARTAEEAQFIYGAVGDIIAQFGRGSDSPLRDRLVEEVGEIVRLMRESNETAEEVERNTRDLRDQTFNIFIRGDRYDRESQQLRLLRVLNQDGLAVGRLTQV